MHQSIVLTQLRTACEKRVKELTEELDALETVLEVLPKPKRQYRKRKVTNGRRRKAA